MQPFRHLNVTCKFDEVWIYSNWEQVAQEGNNRSPEEQLAQGINIIWNSKRSLVELLKLLELKPNWNQKRFLHNKNALWGYVLAPKGT